MTGHSASAAGVSPPDTKLAAGATELVRESTIDLVFNHSRRVYWFGSLLGRDRGLSFDPVTAVPGFERRDFVKTIENSPWPE